MSELSTATAALTLAASEMKEAKESFELVRQDADAAIDQVQQEMLPTKAEVQVHSEVFATHGRKNLLINGKPLVWQAGESFTETGYCADQWFANLSGAVCTKDADPAKGILISINQDQGSGQLHQLIEEGVVQQLRNKELTFSAEYEVNNQFDGDLVLEVFYSNEGDAESEVTNSLITKRFTPTKSVVGVESLTFTVPSDALGLRVAILPAIGQPVNSQMGLYNAQLETGASNTVFEVTPYQEELLKCCRFFYVSKNYHFTRNYANVNFNADVYHLVPMRTLPSITPVFPASSFDVAIWPNYLDSNEKFHMNSSSGGSCISGYMADARL
ncbi:hypothetical protein OA92_15340 [Marinomonas sp. SBI22]|uniref:hypothetical protein n=1 Tax=unclassified Marinomonas TaxID=196814 RepID=UPI0007AFC20B|nr:MULTISPECIES: hypothetical protein [unclassified Marinomonas]KZM40952.1 hypothetical protein OA92_15340 [Marinomonas sp. SBI22]KZM42792.1 hypothetical protein OA91_13545 [Marinomonas sp. SBI8L]